MRSDARRDQRGFAIKVMGVAGEKILAEEPHTQDFLLSSAPRFFIRNVRDYVVLTRYAVKPPAIRILPLPDTEALDAALRPFCCLAFAL